MSEEQAYAMVRLTDPIFTVLDEDGNVVVPLLGDTPR